MFLWARKLNNEIFENQFSFLYLVVKEHLDSTNKQHRNVYQILIIHIAQESFEMQQHRTE